MIGQKYRHEHKCGSEIRTPRRKKKVSPGMKKKKEYFATGIHLSGLCTHKSSYPFPNPPVIMRFTRRGTTVDPQLAACLYCFAAAAWVGLLFLQLLFRNINARPSEFMPPGDDEIHPYSPLGCPALIFRGGGFVLGLHDCDSRCDSSIGGAFRPENEVRL